MIRNLRDTTLKNAEQDWLKTNLAKFTRMLQGERDLVTVSNLILSEIAPLVNAQRGVFYMVEDDGERAGARPRRQLRLHGAQEASPTASACAKGSSASAPTRRSASS